jgi:hypothetical protein
MNLTAFFNIAWCVLVFVGICFPRARLIRVRDRFVETETFNPFRWLILQRARQRWITRLLSTGYPMSTESLNVETNAKVGVYEWRGVRRALLSVGELHDAWKEAAK